MSTLISLALMASSALAASPNITGKISSVSVTGDAEKTLHFSVEVQNTGDAAAAGTLRVKPFLVAADDERAAVVLTNLDVAIDLAAGAGTSLSYSKQLPLLPSKTWLVGAILNPNWAINEDGPRFKYDNTPDLVEVGALEVTSAAPVEATLWDLFPRVVSDHEVSWGTINHSLRAIMRGTNQRHTYQDEDLRALFGVFSTETKKVTLLDYNRQGDPEDPEKSWYAISWNQEKEGNGNPVVVDYYHNNIMFSHVKPGKYRFFTLLNSRDLIAEGNFMDNMETNKVDLSLATFPQSDVVYIGSKKGEAVTRTVRFTGTYAGPLAYTAAVGAETGLTVSEGVTGTAHTDGTVTLTSASEAAGVREGLLGVVGTVTTDDGMAATHSGVVSIPVKHWVFEGEAPALTVSTTSLAFVAHQERESAPQPLMLTNTGGAELVFKLKASKSWISVSPSEGTIAPGQSLSVTVKTLGSANLGAGYYQSDDMSQITIQSNAVQATEVAPIGVQLSIRNE